VNCRDRIGAATGQDAGNYLLTHVTEKDEFRSPGSMRASFAHLDHLLTDYSRKPLLPVAEVLRLMESNLGSITNWSGPQTELELPGCVQVGVARPPPLRTPTAPHRL
jgi:hypothetical protein